MRSDSSTGRTLVWRLVAALVFLMALAWGVDRAILEEERAAVSASLQGLLATTTHTVTGWLDDRKTFLELLGRSKRVQQAVAEALDGPGVPAPLAEILKDHACPFDLNDGVLVDRRGTVLCDVADAAESARMRGKDLVATALPYVDRAWRGETVIAPPMLVNLGGTEAPDMLALTPISGSDGATRAVLVLSIEPRVFSALVDETRPGMSGEVEVFDREGRMLNESRYLDLIVKAGVLPAGTRSTILALDLRNPGVDLRTGLRSDLPTRAQPLTAMVASAVEGRGGVDVRGYYDYRGVRSVAAWNPIGSYGFGLAVKMDYTEAFSTILTLRLIGAALFGLLGLALGVLLARSYLLERERRRTLEAEQLVERLGQYALRRKLGEGGMGEVYLGQHALLHRPTAIKVMRRAASGADDLARFQREVQLGCRLVHPNTIAIFDYGSTEDGRFYYVMEYLDGIHLGQLVERFGVLPPGRVAHILAQVCASLAEAHDMALIHRDIKPENIMLCRRGGVPDHVKVLDFGLVKSLEVGAGNLTAASVVCGTPAYIPPEAVLGEPLDGRADLYAVGAVGYFLLTGRPLFERESLLKMMLAQANELPVRISDLRPDVPADLEGVLMRALCKRPSARQADARTLRDELLSCACAAQWNEPVAAMWWQQHANDLTPEPAPEVKEALALRLATEPPGSLS